MSDNEYSVLTMDITTDPGGDKKYVLMRAPDYCTIKRLTVWTNTAHNAGTAVAVSLQNFGTAGTAVITGGTVSATLGGTADPFSANVPYTTASMTAPILTAGQYLAVSLDEQGAGWQSGEIMRVAVDVQFGLAADI